MKGDALPLMDYLAGSKNRFIIPVYQRNYDWKETHCKRLFDDLIKVIKNKFRQHFLGSIVSVFNKNGSEYEYLVIDGQQRITSISLLLLAMYNLMRENIIKAKDENLIDLIYNEYLVDQYKNVIKLKLINKDHEAFKRLFEDKAEHIKDSRVTINYEYFYKRIQNENLQPDNLFRALNCLEIIDIQLDDKDKPQLIFESLNSTGLELSEGDKIRNYVLMSLPVKEQNNFYEKYWNRIEENTTQDNEYHADMFIRDYLSVKQRRVPAISSIYFTFKDFVETNNFETEDLLKELLSYSRFYNLLIKPEEHKDKDKNLTSCIYRLNWLKTTVTRPFFLEILRLESEGELSHDDTLNIFLVIENYILRRSVCDMPTNALNKLFVALHNEIIKYDGDNKNYFEKLKHALLSKKGNTVLPRDEDFIKDFAHKDLFSSSNKNKLVYILERLENFGTAESKNIYENFGKIGGYSIEHIMPQKLTPEWTRELGANYQRIYDIWLNKIANLTLTAYNSKYSNKIFSEKRDMKDGFKQSGFRLNLNLSKLDAWGEAELEQRSEELKQRALEIWPLPETNFKASGGEFDTCSLDDEFDLTNKTLKKFAYQDDEYSAKNWIDMFEQVVKMLHSEDRYILNNLADKPGYLFVSHNKDKFTNFIEIDSGLYVRGTTSTKDKISYLKKLFENYQRDPSDLIFYLDN
ncbi:MAG: DUF262 domain-containing protein [Synergistaceae bacterium]|nr:DUF262 domain-containing protein [Synergistaceae bacterium]